MNYREIIYEKMDEELANTGLEELAWQCTPFKLEDNPSRIIGFAEEERMKRRERIV